jgi:hypothetical protein
MIIDELFEAPQQCPECGGISFSDLILAEKKDACYHKVKAMSVPRYGRQPMHLDDWYSAT